MIVHTSCNERPSVPVCLARVISHRRFIFPLLLLLLLQPLASPALATPPVIFRVKPNGAISGDCATWATACDLQYALSTAPASAETWVMKGTYKPVKTTDRNATFQLKNGVGVYGGFAGTETTRDKRKWKTNVTILSGDIGAAGNTDNVYHVVTGSGTDSTAVLDGFTIKGGNANSGATFGSCPLDCGGGMYNDAGSPTLANLTFTANSAQRGGAGMYDYDNSSPVLTNVTFKANTDGGMVNCVGSSPTLNNVTFKANSGVGMFNALGSSPIVNNVSFEANKDGGAIACQMPSPILNHVPQSVVMGGTGMYNSDNSNPTVNNVTFVGSSDGGMINSDSSPTLTNVTFSSNAALYWGGGMMNFGSNPTLTNVTFAGNSAKKYGGAMINSNQSNPILTNVTFAGNKAVEYGGAIYNMGSSPTVKNSILWGNTAPSGAQVYNTDASSSPAINDSVVQGGCPDANTSCVHLITADPVLLALAGNGGPTKTMALGAQSSAVDAAQLADCPDMDQRGLPRSKANGYCDMGAYEAQPKKLAITVGTPQSARINSPFSSPLVVTVRDAYQNALGGVSVTFTAPSSGPSATLGPSAASDASGLAWVWATANGSVGPYKVSAIAAGMTTAALFKLSNVVSTENEDSSIQYTGWMGGGDPFASKGTKRTSEDSGDSAAFKFSGTSVTWVTYMGPDAGRAQILVDGADKGTIDLYSPSPQYSVKQMFKGLPTGAHTLVILVVGGAGGQKVVVDAFIVGTTTTQDNSTKVQYDSWVGVTNTSASGGSYRSSGTLGAMATLAFSGDAITWVTAEGPAMGQAEVWIDGALKATVDLYAPSAQWKVPIGYSGLGVGPHSITIKVLGTKNINSNGTTIVVDAFK